MGTLQRFTCVLSVYMHRHCSLCKAQSLYSELGHCTGPNKGRVTCLGRARLGAIIHTVKHSDSFISMLRNHKLLELIFILHFVD